MVPPIAKCGVGAMSNRSSGAAELAVPRAPNLDSRADDPVDKAGHAILGLLHQAASTLKLPSNRPSKPLGSCRGNSGPLRAG